MKTQYDDFEYEDDDGYFADRSYSPYVGNSFYNPIKSTSEYLRKAYLFDSFYDLQDSKENTEEVLHDTLKELNKTINITTNSYVGEEKQLIVKYSDGKVYNDLLENTLYVSPSILLDDELKSIEKNDEFYAKLDGLNGQAMLCAFMKKNVHPFSAIQYKNSQTWAIRNIYMTDMQSKANSEIFLSWPGFMSYVTQQMHVFGQQKNKIVDNIKQSINTGKINLDDIIDLLCYNRLSHDRISYDFMPEQLKNKAAKADALLNSSLNATIENDRRFERSEAIYEKLKNIFDAKEQSDEGLFSVEPSNSSLDRSFTGGNSYNEHSLIDGDIISGSVDHTQKLREKTKIVDDKLSSNQLSNDEALTDRTYKLIIPAVNQETRESYNNIVAQNKSSIKDIKTAFQFKNNESTTCTYGLPDGVLDENSLYKIHFEEFQRLYERKDILQSKKYHVCIAVDQSGSMSGKMPSAAALAIIMAEALKEIRNLDFSVYGFNTHQINTIVYRDKIYQKTEALSESTASGSTALGYHIAAIADKVHIQNNNIEKKIMFVITDGAPTHGSHILSAVDHTAHAVKSTRKLGIDVYGIGVMNAFDQSIGKKIFGVGNFTVINTIKETLPILVMKLKKYLQKI